MTELVFSAETDRVFSAQGHTLDGANKAMELVEIVGRDHATDLLPLVAPTMAISRGAEEDAHWHQPIEIIEPLRIAEGRLPDTLGQGCNRQWKEDSSLIATLLGENPLAIINALEGALRAGARPTDLTQRISYAAALRLARFAVSNDVSDWFNPQHTFIYTNAVHQMLKRAATPLTIRAIFHAALGVYMDRFLNVPPAPLPGQREGLDDLPSDAAELRKQLLHVLDQRAEINAAAQLVARYVRLGHPLDALIDTLTYATVREDLDFHTIQVLEAGVQQCQEWVGRPEVEHILVGVVRQLAAFCPTRRGSLQRATIALRLHRGEKIYEEE